MNFIHHPVEAAFLIVRLLLQFCLLLSHRVLPLFLFHETEQILLAEFSVVERGGADADEADFPAGRKEPLPAAGTQ